MAMDQTKTTPHVDPEHDILSILVADNLGVDELIVMLHTASEPSARRRLVELVGGVLDLHFAIERSFLFPLAGEGRAYGVWTSDAALRQQKDIETTMEDLTGADVARLEFERARDELAGKVRHYIRVEEDELFPALRRVTPVDDLNAAGRLAASAKAAASPRPALPDL